MDFVSLFPIVCGVLDRYGYPTLLLLMLGCALWRFASWIAPRLEQVLEANVHLVQTISTEAPKQTEAIRQIGSMTTELVASTNRSTSILESMNQKQDELHRDVRMWKGGGPNDDAP